MTEFWSVSPDDLWSKAAVDQFPDTVPVHGITIMEALRPNGHRGLHVIHDTGAPVWVLIGMIKCVLADLEALWVDSQYKIDDESELEDDDEL